MNSEIKKKNIVQKKETDIRQLKEVFNDSEQSD